MKRILLSCLLILFIYTLKAQDTHLNDVVNTLKERISLAGYAQVGYTYDDAGEKASNTFDIKRVIFMARGKITDKWSCYFMYSFANTGKILEAYTEYQFLPQLTARIGQFKTMYTIENPMSPCFVELINCYSQAVNYLAGINGSDPLYGSKYHNQQKQHPLLSVPHHHSEYHVQPVHSQKYKLKPETVHHIDWENL